MLKVVGTAIDLMHWRHISITTTPCWGSRLVALRARVVLAEHIGAQPLSQCAGPGQPGGMACRGWPSGCMLGDGARDSATFDPQHAWAPFCDVICTRSITVHKLSVLSMEALHLREFEKQKYAHWSSLNETIKVLYIVHYHIGKIGCNLILSPWLYFDNFGASLFFKPVYFLCCLMTIMGLSIGVWD